MAPTAKQFKAVDINRRFLAKNTSGNAAKLSAATAPCQPAHAHSRLVSTKLTRSPAPVPHGWSTTPSSPLPSAPPLPQPPKPAWRLLAPAPLPPKPHSHEADTFRGLHLDPNAHHWDEVRSPFSQ